jgi:hypothetical protein
MSFTARTQSLASRTQALITHLNQGDGVRTPRPTGTEARQLLGIVGGTAAFVLITLSLGFLALLAR